VKAAPVPVSPPPPQPLPAPVPVAAAPPPPQPPPPIPAGLRASPAARQRAKELGIDLAAVKGTGPGGAITLNDVEKTVPIAHAPRVHPVARKMAEALGVDLSKVTGTGASGTITKADVEKAAPAVQAPAVPEARDRAASMRRAIGAAMARSKREIPHYYLATEIDMRRALAWLEGENRNRPVEERLLPAAVLLKAVALALRKVPELNGFWVDGAFQPSAAIHLGVAVAIRGGGLIAPAIHDTDQKSLGELMGALRDLVQRARAGTLRSSEMSDPTITVTNLGDQGVGTVFGVIYPPQVALVGLGRIAERPWAENGLLGVRPVLTATLSADHRATDGHRGGLFLAALDHLLQEPEKL
jgi:pyruvate dehydrogenase E2 component (dihydrolipoamide acetyltransferase)